jgi:hypothetical protein
MSDFEKHRTQSDARRAVRRRTGSAVAEQAVLRHLGVELYKERRQAEKPAREDTSEDSTDR